MTDVTDLSMRRQMVLFFIRVNKSHGSVMLRTDCELKELDDEHVF